MSSLDEACYLRDLVFYYLKDSKNMTDLQLVRMLTIWKKVDNLCEHIAFEGYNEEDNEK